MISAALLITVIITGLMKDLQFSVLFSPLVIVLSAYWSPASPEHACYRLRTRPAPNRKKDREESFEAVHWQDILALRKLPTSLEYVITRRGGKALTLDNFYQDIDELVTLIRQRSRKEGENP